MNAFTDQAATDFSNGFSEIKQTVTQRQSGDSSACEIITNAIFDDSNTAAARASSLSGLVANEQGKQDIRLALLDVPVATEITDRDTYEIDDQLWSVMGHPVEVDALTKTIVLKRISALNTKRPRGR